MPRTTRKASKVGTKTIPELRKSFERMDSFLHSKVGKLSEKEGVKAFKQEWKRLFGKGVSDEAALEYIRFTRKGSSASSASSKDKQEGGAAPLSYDMQPGAEPQVTPLPYVSGGFGFANNDSLVLGGPKDYLLAVPESVKATVGGGQKQKQKKHLRTTKKKKQAGGSISSTFAEFSNRPFGSGSPSSALQDLQGMAKGGLGGASPLPEINRFPHLTQQASIYSGSINNSVRLM
jgi:hypothetical protein